MIFLLEGVSSANCSASGVAGWTRARRSYVDGMAMGQCVSAGWRKRSYGRVAVGLRVQVGYEVANPAACDEYADGCDVSGE